MPLYLDDEELKSAEALDFMNRSNDRISQLEFGGESDDSIFNLQRDQLQDDYERKVANPITALIESQTPQPTPTRDRWASDTSNQDWSPDTMPASAIGMVDEPQVIWQRQPESNQFYEANSDIGGGNPTAAPGEIESYIREAARRRGIDPDVAVAVAKSEGGLDDPVRPGDYGSSFGPYQLHMAGMAGGGNEGSGLGDTALQHGIDPRNPAHWRQAIDFSLDQAAQSGWGPWHGAQRIGLPNDAGLQGAKPIGFGGVPTEDDAQWRGSIQDPNRQQRVAGSGMGVKQEQESGDGGTLNRPSQFGVGLSAADANAACGPVLAMAFANKYGRNPTAQEAVDLAKQFGWTADQGMAGVDSQVKLMQAMGVPAAKGAVDWDKIATDVQNGNPVGIDTAGHYFAVSGYDPATGRFDLGTSATDLRAAGGRRWFKPEEIEGLGFGAPRTAIYVDNPGSPSPSFATVAARRGTDVTKGITVEDLSEDDYNNPPPPGGIPPQQQEALAKLGFGGLDFNLGKYSDATKRKGYIADESVATPGAPERDDWNKRPGEDLTTATGMTEPGNIDLNNRPQVHNEDGTTSTLRSISIEDDDGDTVLIPTISDDGKKLSNKDAIALYESTGRHLGKFNSEEAADRFAKTLSEGQGSRLQGWERDEPQNSLQFNEANQDIGGGDLEAPQLVGPGASERQDDTNPDQPSGLSRVPERSETPTTFPQTPPTPLYQDQPDADANRPRAIDQPDVKPVGPSVIEDVHGRLNAGPNAPGFYENEDIGGQSGSEMAKHGVEVLLGTAKGAWDQRNKEAALDQEIKEAVLNYAPLNVTRDLTIDEKRKVAEHMSPEAASRYLGEAFATVYQTPPSKLDSIPPEVFNANTKEERDAAIAKTGWTPKTEVDDKNPWSRLAKGVGSNVAGIFAGLGAGIDSFASSDDSLLTRPLRDLGQTIYKTMSEKAAENTDLELERRKWGLDKAEKEDGQFGVLKRLWDAAQDPEGRFYVAQEVLPSVAQNALEFVAGALLIRSGNLGAAGRVAVAEPALNIFLQESGQAFRNARLAGVDAQKAAVIGNVVGAINTYVEFMPWDKMLPHGDDVAKTAVRLADGTIIGAKNALRDRMLGIAKEIGTDMLTEGTEEVIQAFTGNLAQRTYDPNADLSQGMAAGFVYGALGGGVGSATMGAVGRRGGAPDTADLLSPDQVPTPRVAAPTAQIGAESPVIEGQSRPITDKGPEGAPATPETPSLYENVPTEKLQKQLALYDSRSDAEPLTHDQLTAYNNVAQELRSRQAALPAPADAPESTEAWTAAHQEQADAPTGAPQGAQRIGGLAVPETQARPGTPEGDFETIARSSVARPSAGKSDGLAHVSAEDFEKILPQANQKFPAKYSDLDDYREVARQGLKFKDWYVDFANKARGIVGDNNLGELFAVVSVTSNQIRWDVNLGQALKVMAQVRERAENNNGKLKYEDFIGPDSIKFARGLEPQRRQLWSLYKNGSFEADSSLKTPIFNSNFRSAGTSEYNPFSTQDMWQGRMFGLKIGGGFNQRMTGDTQLYRLGNAVSGWIAREMGISPHQVQAAQWTVMKNLEDHAPELFDAWHRGEITLGDAVRQASEKGAFKTAIQGYTADAWDGNSVKKVLAEWGHRVGPEHPGPEKASSMRFTSRGGREGDFAITPEGLEQAGEDAQGQAPAIRALAPVDRSELASIGLGERNTLSWITVPHRLVANQTGTFLTFPGGNIDTAVYYGVLIGEQLDLESIDVHVADPRAENDRAGFRILNRGPGGKLMPSERVEAFQRELGSRGVEFFMAPSGGLIQIPAFDRDGQDLADIIYEAASSAGWTSDDFESRIVRYRGDNERIDRSEYQQAAQGLDATFGARRRSDLPDGVRRLLGEAEPEQSVSGPVPTKRTPRVGRAAARQDQPETKEPRKRGYVTKQARALEAFRNGDSVPVVANELGISESLARQWKRVAGLTKTGKPDLSRHDAVIRQRVDEGASDAAIGGEIGETAGAVRNYRSENKIAKSSGRSQSPEGAREQALRHVADGKTPTAAAREVGVSYEAVRKWVKAEGGLDAVREQWTAAHQEQTDDTDPRLKASRAFAAKHGVPFARGLAEGYVQDVLGKSGLREIARIKPDPTLQRKLAVWGVEQGDKSSDPAVRKAYRQLVKEVDQQYEYAVDHGMVFEPFGAEGEAFEGSDPYQEYARNWNQDHADAIESGREQKVNASDIMRQDVAGRFDWSTGQARLRPDGEAGPPHLWVYHGDLTPRSVMDGEENWRFRAVHDLFGHAVGGNTFGSQGELNAAMDHSRMFSPEAWQAGTMELQWQNSYTNYYPGHEQLAVPDRPFAEQHANLPPVGLTRRSDIYTGTEIARLGAAADQIQNLPQGATLRSVESVYPELLQAIDDSGVEVVSAALGRGGVGQGMWDEGYTKSDPKAEAKAAAERLPIGSERDLDLIVSGTRQQIEWLAASIGQSGNQSEVIVAYDDPDGDIPAVTLRLGAIGDSPDFQQALNMAADQSRGGLGGWHLAYNPEGQAIEIFSANRYAEGDARARYDDLLGRVRRVRTVLEQFGFKSELPEYSLHEIVSFKQGDYDGVIQRGPGGPGQGAATGTQRTSDRGGVPSILNERDRRRNRAGQGQQPAAPSAPVPAPTGPVQRGPEYDLDPEFSATIHQGIREGFPGFEQSNVDDIVDNRQAAYIDRDGQVWQVESHAGSATPLIEMLTAAEGGDKALGHMLDRAGLVRVNAQYKDAFAIEVGAPITPAQAAAIGRFNKAVQDRPSKDFEIRGDKVYNEFGPFMRAVPKDESGTAHQVQGEGRTAIGLSPDFFRKEINSRYTGDRGQIAIKEMVQNSVDASRPKEGRQDIRRRQVPRPGRQATIPFVPTTTIRVDQPERTIRVTDQGIGMTPGIVQNEFTKLGGSSKPGGASGGFGTAKVAVLGNADQILLRTIARQFDLVDTNGDVVASFPTRDQADTYAREHPDRFSTFNTAKDPSIDPEVFDSRVRGGLMDSGLSGPRRAVFAEIVNLLDEQYPERTQRNFNDLMNHIAMEINQDPNGGWGRRDADIEDITAIRSWVTSVMNTATQELDYDVLDKGLVETLAYGTGDEYLDPGKGVRYVFGKPGTLRDHEIGRMFPSAFFTNWNGENIDDRYDISQQGDGTWRIVDNRNGEMLGENLDSDLAAIDLAMENDIQTGTMIQVKIRPDAKWNTDSAYAPAVTWMREFGGQSKLRGQRVKFELDGGAFATAHPLGDPQRDDGSTWTPSKLVQTIELPEASLDFYAAEARSEQEYIQYSILNEGMPQLTSEYMQLPSQAKVPVKMSVDVRSKVKAGEGGYPWSVDRMRVTESVQEAIKNFMVRDLAAAAIREEREGLRKAIQKGRKIIPGMLFVDSTDSLNTDTADMLSGGSYMKPLARGIKEVFDRLSNDVTLRTVGTPGGQRPAEASKMLGFGTSRGWLGLSVNADLVDDQHIGILMNPWGLWQEATTRARQFSEEGVAPLAQVAEEFKRGLRGTLVHEWVHNYVRAHNEDFAGALTRVFPRITDKTFAPIDKAIDRMVRDAEPVYDLDRHTRLWDDYAQEKNIFEKGSVDERRTAPDVSGQPASGPTTGERVRDQGLPEGRQEAGRGPASDLRGSQGRQPTGTDLRRRDVAHATQVDPFYSQLERTIQEKLPNRVSVEQLEATLRNNAVKPDEVKWTGLDEFIEQAKRDKRPVTKQEVLDHLAENAVVIDEVKKTTRDEGDQSVGNTDPEDIYYSIESEYEDENGEKNWVIVSGDTTFTVYQSPDEKFHILKEDAYTSRTVDTWAEIEPLIRNMAANELNYNRETEERDREPGPGEVQYQWLSLPGGEDYTELLLTLPIQEKKLPPGWRLEEITTPTNHVIGHRVFNDKNEYVADGISKQEATSKALGRTSKDAYTGSHWDEPNVLAHVRFDTRVEPTYTVEQIEDIARRISEGLGIPPLSLASGAPGDAVRQGIITQQEANQYSHARKYTPGGSVSHEGATRRILFIQEIQSDWHQAGRKQGYRRERTSEEDRRLEEIRQRRAEIVARRREIESQIIPLYRARNPAETQSPQEARLRTEFADTNAELNELDQEERTMKSYDYLPPEGPFSKTWHELALKRMLRYAAENGYDAIALPTGEVAARIEGGGDPSHMSADQREGLKGFYDKMIPTAAAKLVKKWGTTVVDTTKISTGPVNPLATDLPVLDEIAVQAVDNPILQAAANVAHDVASSRGISVPEAFTFLDQNGVYSSDTMKELRREFGNRMSNTVDVYAIEVNDRMRESVMTEGQALFRESDHTVKPDFMSDSRLFASIQDAVGEDIGSEAMFFTPEENLDPELEREIATADYNRRIARAVRKIDNYLRSRLEGRSFGGERFLIGRFIGLSHQPGWTGINIGMGGKGRGWMVNPTAMVADLRKMGVSRQDMKPRLVAHILATVAHEYAHMGITTDDPIKGQGSHTDLTNAIIMEFGGELLDPITELVEVMDRAGELDQIVGHAERWQQAVNRRESERERRNPQNGLRQPVVERNEPTPPTVPARTSPDNPAERVRPPGTVRGSDEDTSRGTGLPGDDGEQRTQSSLAVAALERYRVTTPAFYAQGRSQSAWIAPDGRMFAVDYHSASAEAILKAAGIDYNPDTAPSDVAKLGIIRLTYGRGGYGSAEIRKPVTRQQAATLGEIARDKGLASFSGEVENPDGTMAFYQKWTGPDGLNINLPRDYPAYQEQDDDYGLFGEDMDRAGNSLDVFESQRYRREGYPATWDWTTHLAHFARISDVRTKFHAVASEWWKNKQAEATQSGLLPRYSYPNFMGMAESASDTLTQDAQAALDENPALRDAFDVYRRAWRMTPPAYRVYPRTGDIAGGTLRVSDEGAGRASTEQEVLEAAFIGDYAEPNESTETFPAARQDLIDEVAGENEKPQDAINEALTRYFDAVGIYPDRDPILNEELKPILARAFKQARQYDEIESDAFADDVQEAIYRSGLRNNGWHRIEYPGGVYDLHAPIALRQTDQAAEEEAHQRDVAAQRAQDRGGAQIAEVFREALGEYTVDTTGYQPENIPDFADPRDIDLLHQRLDDLGYELAGVMDFDPSYRERKRDDLHSILGEIRRSRDTMTPGPYLALAFRANDIARRIDGEPAVDDLVETSRRNAAVEGPGLTDDPEVLAMLLDAQERSDGMMVLHQKEWMDSAEYAFETGLAAPIDMAAYQGSLERALIETGHIPPSLLKGVADYIVRQDPETPQDEQEEWTAAHQQQWQGGFVNPQVQQATAAPPRQPRAPKAPRRGQAPSTREATWQDITEEVRLPGMLSSAHQIVNQFLGNLALVPPILTVKWLEQTGAAIRTGNLAEIGANLAMLNELASLGYGFSTLARNMFAVLMDRPRPYRVGPGGVPYAQTTITNPSNPFKRFAWQSSRILAAPSRVLTEASDILFWVPWQHLSLRRQASAMARKANKRGAAWWTEVNNLTANPTPEMIEEAAAFADRMTLKNALTRREKVIPGKGNKQPYVKKETTLLGKGENLRDLRVHGLPIGKFMIPFARAIGNSFARGIDMTPLGLMGTLFDMTRASKGFGPYAARGMQARPSGQSYEEATLPIDERLALNAFGIAIMFAVASAVRAGLLTGSGPDDDKRKRDLLTTGWKPDHFKIPGWPNYIPTRVLGPLAIPLGATANWVEQTQMYAKAEDTQTAQMLRALSGWKNVFANNTYMGDLYSYLEIATSSGPNTLVKALREASFVTSGIISSQLVPSSGMMRSIARGEDIYQRESDRITQPDLGEFVQATKSNIMQGIPRFRPDLPVKQDLIGRPVRNPNQGVVGALLPPMSEEAPSPLIDAMRSADIGLSRAPKELSTGISGVSMPLTKEEQREWQQMYGELLQKSWNLAKNTDDPETLKELNRLVSRATTDQMLGKIHDRVGRDAFNKRLSRE